MTNCAITTTAMKATSCQAPLKILFFPPTVAAASSTSNALRILSDDASPGSVVLALLLLSRSLSLLCRGSTCTSLLFSLRKPVGSAVVTTNDDDIFRERRLTCTT